MERCVSLIARKIYISTSPDSEQKKAPRAVQLRSLNLHAQRYTTRRVHTPNSRKFFQNSRNSDFSRCHLRVHSPAPRIQPPLHICRENAALTRRRARSCPKRIQERCRWARGSSSASTTPCARKATIWTRDAASCSKVCHILHIAPSFRTDVPQKRRTDGVSICHPSGRKRA